MKTTMSKFYRQNAGHHSLASFYTVVIYNQFPYACRESSLVNAH